MENVSQLLAFVTFALSASAFAVPSNQEEHFFTQTTEYQHTIANDGSDRTPQGQTLASDGSDHTPQGLTLAADGSDHTPGMQVAADGSERALGRRLA
ncbi:hypothetical protein [Pseudomonas akapageensis]|uniref:hypothetical protein n=1 Tax=Pseudomonas akapageensis TaxID=2609961 RepID=UPI00140B8488|nr:hypothetical protein [Pseudomonas akapageensis]